MHCSELPSQDVLNYANISKQNSSPFKSKYSYSSLGVSFRERPFGSRYIL